MRRSSPAHRASVFVNTPYNKSIHINGARSRRERVSGLMLVLILLRTYTIRLCVHVYTIIQANLSISTHTLHEVIWKKYKCQLVENQIYSIFGKSYSNIVQIFRSMAISEIYFRQSLISTVKFTYVNKTKKYVIFI